MAAVADQKPGDALGEERGRALDRAIAFSDGVFAIAITLLVLNFRVPNVSGHSINQKLLDALKDDGGLWLSFALSFLIVARLWMVHHRLSLLLRRIDSRFIVLNLLFLACVVVLPFPTELLGNYGDTITATVLYAAAMTAAGLASTALWQHAWNSHLYDARVTDAWAKRSRANGLSVPIVFALSIPVAFVDADVAKMLWGLLFFQRFLWRHSPPSPYSDGSATALDEGAA